MVEAVVVVYLRQQQPSMVAVVVVHQVVIQLQKLVERQLVAKEMLEEIRHQVVTLLLLEVAKVFLLLVNITVAVAAEVRAQLEIMEPFKVEPYLDPAEVVALELP